MTEEVKNRRMTLYVEVTDKEEAKWIWEAHLKGPLHGISIWSLGSGDAFKEREEATDLLHEVLECRKSSLDTALNDKIHDFLHKIHQL